MTGGVRFAAAAVLSLLPVAALADNRQVVYIECTHDSKPVSQGSGVIVSAEGHVLTARHVVPDGYSCKGTIENRTNPLRGLIRPVQDRNLAPEIDGKLLRFIPNDGEVFDYARFCPVTADIVSQGLETKGFHRNSIAFPSATAGVLSTHISNDVGVVETDAMTISGKSGGPVFLKDTGALIGIVAGAAFEPSGLPAFYGVLTADAVAFSYRIMTMDDSCKPMAAPAVTAAAAPAPVEAPAAQKPVAGYATNSERAKHYYYQADDFYEEEEFGKALELYALAIENDPTVARYYSDRGYTFLLTGKLDEAKADFETAIGLDNTFAEVYGNRAEYFEETGEMDKAIADYDVLLSLTPDDAEAYVWRALAHNYVQNWDEALADFNKAIEIDFQAPDAHAFRGVTYSQLGRMKEALADYSTAIGLDPTNEEIFTDRGITYLEMGRYEDALDDFDTALSINGSLQRAIDGRKDTCSFLDSC